MGERGEGTMKLDTLEKDFHDIVVNVIAEANTATGRNWVCVQGRRTIAYQNNLYAQPTDGKDNDGDGRIDESDEKVTNAKGGQSAHNFGLAADLAPEKSKGIIDWNAPPAIWQAMGNIAIKHGLTWAAILNQSRIYLTLSIHVGGNSKRHRKPERW
jgi:hypothetical protein